MVLTFLKGKYKVNSLKDITVLITAAGNVFMPGTTACLKNNGERKIRLIGADMNDDASILQMCDAYYSVPRGDDPEYVNVLYDICLKEKVDIVLPIMSVELEILAKHKEKFAEAGILISVSDENALEIANNKLALHDFMKENGIDCAKYCKVESVKELESAVYSLGYPEVPVCIKTIKGSGSRGFRIIDASKSKYEALFNEKPNSCYITLEELVDILMEKEEIPTMMVMEFLPGTEYTVDLVADKGEVLYSCCRKSLNMENSIMLDGVTVENAAALEVCDQVVKMLKLDGNIGFDIKERKDGTPVIMECNPRITAGIPMFHAAGVNLPYLCVKKLLKEELPEAELKLGLKMKRRHLEMYY